MIAEVLREMEVEMDNRLFTRVEYVGDAELTRGDYGERISNGYLSSSNGMEMFEVWVWDAAYGWMLYASYTPHEWGSQSSWRALDEPATLLEVDEWGRPHPTW